MGSWGAAQGFFHGDVAWKCFPWLYLDLLVLWLEEIKHSPNGGLMFTGGLMITSNLNKQKYNSNTS